MTTRHPELGSGQTWTPSTASIIHFGTPLPEPSPEFIIHDEHGIEVSR